MPTEADWAAFQKTLTKPHQDALRYQYGAQAEVGRRAETVVQHAGWQTFLDHLEEIRSRVEAKREATAKDILTGQTTGGDLEKARITYAELVGEARGLTMAVDLIPKLVEMGAKATEALEGLVEKT